MKNKKVVIFDLDGTLAESKQAITPIMAKLLEKLLQQKIVCVTSGGGLPQFQTQLLSKLPETTNLTNLILAPTSGASMYVFKNKEMKKVYENILTEEELQKITTSLTKALEQTNFDTEVPSYGDRIEYRGSQVSFSALGQEALLEEKKKYDPNHKKREEIISHLSPLLPNFSIRIGGTTTIDINKPGIDKAYGVKKLSALLSIEIEKMVYVGDALFEGGNDEAVKKSGIETIQIKDPKEVEALIEGFVSDHH